MAEDDSGVDARSRPVQQPGRQLPDGADEVAVLMREEGRLTVDRLNQGLGDIETKASKLMRTNLVLVGLLLSAFSVASRSQSIDPSPFLNSFTAVGVLALVGSTIGAGVTYTSTESRVGISPEVIYGFVGTDLDPAEVESGLAKAYARWIAVNRRANVENAFFATVTTLLVLAAVVLIATGTMVGTHVELFSGVTRQVLWIPVVLFVVAVGHISGARDDYRKWRRYSHKGDGVRDGDSRFDGIAGSGTDAPFGNADDQRYNSEEE